VNINLTLIGQSITFLVFVWFCYKFVWSAIMSALEEREKKIAEGLDQADRAARDLELAKEEAGKKLRVAKEEAAAIIDAANKRASQIVDDAKAAAITEGDRLKEAAQAEIDQQAVRAREQLRAELSALVIEGASKVLEAEVDEKAHAELVSKLAAQL
jgi:F-type H+-transporting ATPase subunit b